MLKRLTCFFHTYMGKKRIHPTNSATLPVTEGRPLVCKYQQKPWKRKNTHTPSTLPVVLPNYGHLNKLTCPQWNHHYRPAHLLFNHSCPSAHLAMQTRLLLYTGTTSPVRCSHKTRMPLRSPQPRKPHRTQDLKDTSWIQHIWGMPELWR